MFMINIIDEFRYKGAFAFSVFKNNIAIISSNLMISLSLNFPYSSGCSYFEE